jgi:hypothetical protein
MASERWTRERSRRFLAGAAVAGFAALAVTSSGVAAAADPADQAPSDTHVVQCSSGIVTQGDVQMSSAYATRVPAGEQADLPGGCVPTS